ncbi:MAG TPA: alpha/beta family hydrolase [Jiangellales bacterium]|nr:alpha/beta family hydrolase [Jiangellales bacterium]
MTEQREVPTPLGPARLLVDRAVRARRTLVLGHGAGGGATAADLVALAQVLPPRTGTTVVRVEQPWRVAGRRLAPAPPRLDEAWQAVVPQIEVVGPLVVGGRSAGARVACRTATGVGAAAVLALAFPLHPPGRPERSRLAELAGAGVPVLVVQGERDAFGRPAEFPPGPYQVVTVPASDHSFAVPRSAPLSRAEVLETLVDQVATWLRGLRE